MMFAALLMGDRSWMFPAVGIVATAVLLLWWAYRGLSVTAGIRGCAAVLKMTGITLLAVCLVEPLWSGTRACPGANIFAVLADTSQSLQIRDGAESKSCGDLLRGLLADEKLPWRVRLDQDFDVRRYLIDASLRGTDDFSQLQFDGEATSLATALRTLRDRFQGRPLAGVLLFSDGNATDLNSGSIDTRGLPPIYPVLIGNETVGRDVAIENVAVSQTSFEDSPVTIRADVVAHGYADSELVARLFDEAEQLIEESTQQAGTDGKPLTFRFQLRPKKPGISFYRLRVAAKDEIEQFDQPGASREATLANNTRLIQVDRGQGPLRILYVSGRPNWEFKFLRRAIEGDEQIDLVGLIRIAKREPKFDWRGRAEESSNPLFRGFKKKSDEETERYDQPVLVRLNTKDARELQGGFPKRPAELYSYHAVVVDDVEAEFFTHNQLALLERFVSERGGGVLMLGGLESFHEGGYRRTPVGEMLPVYLDRAAAGRPHAKYRMTLTREGWLQPWIRLRPNESDERVRLDEMPAFGTLNRVGSVKPGASVLAMVSDDAGNQHPALIVHRYGRGRCAALTVGDLWRWQLRRSGDSDDLAKAWRQMLRWLVADVPQRIDIHVKPRPDVSGAAIQLQVRIRDSEHKRLDNATVRITVKPPARKPIQLDAEPSLKEAGLYEALFVPRQRGADLPVGQQAGKPAPPPGAYRAEVKVAGGAGEKLGTAQTGWATDSARDEFRSIAANRPLMQQLAQQTGGELVAADDLESFVNSLSTRRLPITEQWTYPLWHQVWVFLMAVGCLTGEWGLRRWKGLP